MTDGVYGKESFCPSDLEFVAVDRYMNFDRMCIVQCVAQKNWNVFIEYEEIEHVL